ncbi:hypothetical protein Nepgr_021702 [Nepenthes gracilis]|uniref:Uncharacterized protein n=1 Tax=Nepenthes gracilis TaxID=150966 RepID=A0AAD3XXM8_NEPGR|nr:hypothetical protein Nepgr_021702 [Nepenthes gracilis]
MGLGSLQPRFEPSIAQSNGACSGKGTPPVDEEETESPLEPRNASAFDQGEEGVAEPKATETRILGGREAREGFKGESSRRENRRKRGDVGCGRAIRSTSEFIHGRCHQGEKRSWTEREARNPNV